MNKKIILLGLMLILAVVLVKAQQDKVFVVNFHYEDGIITMKDSTIKLGYYPDRKFQPEEGHRVEVVSVGDEKLYSFRFKLPLEEFTDYAAWGELKGSLIRLSETDFSLILPYFKDIKEINFYNERNYKVAAMVISEEMLSPKKEFGFSLSVYLIMALVVAGLVYVIVKKRKRTGSNT